MVSGSNAENSELADTLRREDPEQFHTLVRMHLSFVLDLNTDECDGIVEKVGKFRPMKWSFTPFGKKVKPTNRGPTEGIILTQDVICHVYHLIQWLSQEQNVIQEGIFRRSGKMTRQQELKTLLNNGSPLQLDEGRFSVHDCASVLKNFLAQLPEPLLTEAHYPAHCQIAELCSGNDPPEEERLLKALQLILLLLPLENLQLLRDLIGLLHLTASHANSNKMSADNLATLFTPHLLCPRKLSPEALHINSQIMSRVVSFMIQQGPMLFHVPVQLATDIRAYWTAREKRKLMPRKDLNESLCDGMAARTVFTFVDRERSEASASANPTEAALAQLYAHIQSLPESSKKRKLIKQFNKENGQGTPQLVTSMIGSRTSRSRQRSALPQGTKPRQRSRSLGDSIKKHIPVFNKGQKKGSDNAKEFVSSPHSSPASRVKLFFQKSLSEGEGLNASPGTGLGSMPSLKKSLLCDGSGGEAEPLKLCLLANTKRPPAVSSVTKDNFDNKEDCTSSSSIAAESTNDERCQGMLKRSASATVVGASTHELGCSPTKSPRLEPESSFSVPLPPPSGRITSSPEAKRSTGTFRDDSWPVSTVPSLVTASSSGNRSPPGLPNSHVLTTPRNVLAWMTSTPAYARASCPPDGSAHSNCLLTPSNATGNNSMSPITRSTQKMPKAMQEDMMTPRSRKPVVALSSSNLCQLAHFGGWGRSGSGELRRDATSRATLLSEAGATLNQKLSMMEESFLETEDEGKYYTDLGAEDSVQIPIGRMLAKELQHQSTTIQEPSSELQGCECDPDKDCTALCGVDNGSLDYYSCSSEGSALTGTFREIVLSRSVLTASPVDLSFSSRTGDFDSSSEREEKLILSNEKLSDSLLYCLDGNDPSNLNIIEKSTTVDKVLGCDEGLDDCDSSGVEAGDDLNVSGDIGTVHDSMLKTDSKIEVTSMGDDGQHGFNNLTEDASDSLLSNDSNRGVPQKFIVHEIDLCKTENSSVNETSL